MDPRSWSDSRRCLAALGFAAVMLVSTVMCSCREGTAKNLVSRSGYGVGTVAGAVAGCVTGESL